MYGGDPCGETVVLIYVGDICMGEAGVDRGVETLDPPTATGFAGLWGVPCWSWRWRMSFRSLSPPRPPEGEALGLPGLTLCEPRCATRFLISLGSASPP